MIILVWCYLTGVLVFNACCYFLTVEPQLRCFWVSLVWPVAIAWTTLCELLDRRSS